MDDKQPSTMRDVICDAILAGRHTLRVAPTKSPGDGVTSYFVSFLLNIDAQAHERLVGLADKRERSAEKMLRRLIKEALADCLSEDEEELKAA